MTLNHRALFVGLALFLLLRCVGMAQSANGGFESGDLASWGGDQEGAAVTSEPRYVHSGNYGVQLGTVGPLGHLTQTLATTPGSNYLISLWLNNTNGGSPNEFRVSWNQFLLYYATNMTNLAWTNIQLSVTAFTTNDTLQLGFRQDPNYLGLDDVSVTPIAAAAPIIITQPTNQAVTLSSNATFVVIATGVPMPKYYWSKNGLPIASGTNLTYNITNVQATDAGQFICVVSNASGTATSQVATLTVAALTPTIIQQPSSLSVVGGYASFSVSAFGSQPLSYFWRRNGAFMAGATNFAYSINNVQPGDSGSVFNCLVSNAFGTIVSGNALLTVTTNLSASTVVYLRSAAGEPWGRTDNAAMLNWLYGAGWQALYFETANPAALFSRSNRFIFIEGSADGEPAMETFLLNNLSTLTNWVAGGGSLFLDCAPYFLSSFTVNAGFGVTLSVGEYTETAVAVSPAHPIFNGPFGPVGNSFSGAYLAHATVSGPGLSGILTNASGGKFVLAERVYGAGHLMFGGVTLPAFQAPQVQASNLWANILYNAGLQSAVGRTRLSLVPVGIENCTFNYLAEGTAGSSFFVQTSSNLQHWVTILTNAMPLNGSMLIADPSACNSNRRFYRGALMD